MLGIIKKDVYTKQPPNYVRPEYDGLLAVFSGSLPQELLSGDFPTTDSSTSVLSGGSIARSYNNNQTTYTNSKAVNANSILCVIDVDILQGYGHIIGCQDSSTGPGFELRLGTSPDNNGLLLHLSGTNGYHQQTSGVSAVSAGDKNVPLIVTFSDAISIPANFYHSGNKYVGTAGPGTMLRSANTHIGRRVDDATQLYGAIHLLALFDRVLPDAEALSLLKNPWKIFPKRQRYFIFTGEVAGVQNVSASVNLLVRSSETTTKISSSSADAKLLVRSSSTSSKIADSSISPKLLVRTSEVSEKIANSNASGALLVRTSVTMQQIAPGVVNMSASALLLARSSISTGKIADVTSAPELLIRSSVTSNKVSNSSASAELLFRTSNTVNKIANASSVVRLLLRRPAPVAGSTLQPPDIIAGLRSANLLYNASHANKQLGLRHAS
jgi:hypothetical protein